MSEKSAASVVRRSAKEIPATSPEELARMLAIPDESIDFSEIPELPSGEPSRSRSSIFRDAIAAAMAERGMSPHSLWTEARSESATISEAEVGAFLQGGSRIRLPDLEALVSAAGLTIVRKS